MEGSDFSGFGVCEVALTGKIHQSQNQPVRTLLDDAGETLIVIRETG
jgi:hypothetical protein